MNKTQFRAAIKKNRLYDEIANEYYTMTKDELKEVLLAVLGVMYDNCKGNADEEALMDLIDEELANRDFWEE